MGQKNESILTAIDIGTAKTVALAVEITDGGLRYRGHGIAESRGTRKGIIVDLDKAAAAVKKAVDEAEAVVGGHIPLESAVLGVSGPQLRGVTSQGGIALGSRQREISREDISAAVEKARSIPLPEDRSILHLLQQDFIVDGQGAVRDPAGMLGRQLEVRVHIVTLPTTTRQSFVTATNLASVQVDDTICEALAASDAVLMPDERELGVCVADIGAGTTDFVVLNEGVVVHVGTIPIGGGHFTNDVAVGMRTPLADAEKIKRMFGCAVVTSIPETNEIEVPSVGDRPARMEPQRRVAEILEPRARELFEMLRDNLRQAGVADMLGSGLVLTGGGARLNNITEVAEDVMHRPARIGYPHPVDKIPAVLAEPEFATVIGLAFYAHRARMLRGREEQGFGAKLKALFAKTSFGL